MHLLMAAMNLETMNLETMNLESIISIFEELKKKDIYCWGSGRYFRNHSLPFLRESKLYNNFRGCVDKAKLLKLSDELSDESSDGAVVIISVAGYREILSQLQANPKLAGFPAIPSIFLEALYEDMLMLQAQRPPKNYRKNKEMSIPKVIHTFWFSDQYDAPCEYHKLNNNKAQNSNPIKNQSNWLEEIELPERYKACLESWKKYAPDFEIIIWNQYSYHPENCIFYEQAIENKCWAFASDYARADVLRRFGGVYMDLDVELLRPIDDLLYNDAYMSFESLSRIECGSGMGAKAGNRILDQICKDYESRPFIKADGSFDMSTCPVRFTNVIEKHGLVKNGGFQMVDDITIYPFEYLTGKSFDTGIIYSTEESYSLHHHNGSWIPGNTQQSMDQRYADIKKFIRKWEKD